MANFGWSYPAGCTGTPFDEDPGEECGAFGCKNDNADEDGEPVFPADPGFCSEACRDDYVGAVAAQAEALACEHFDCALCGVEVPASSRGVGVYLCGSKCREAWDRSL